MKKLCDVIIFTIFLCSVAVGAGAQDTTGTISGRVVDAPLAMFTVVLPAGAAVGPVDGDEGAL